MLNKLQKMRSKKGFTLMELLVVIAIIVILVAIIIPVMSGQTEKARDAADLANARSATALVAIHLLENPEVAPADIDTWAECEALNEQIAGIEFFAGDDKVTVTNGIVTVDVD